MEQPSSQFIRTSSLAGRGLKGSALASRAAHPFFAIARKS